MARIRSSVLATKRRESKNSLGGTEDDKPMPTDVEHKLEAVKHAIAEYRTAVAEAAAESSADSSVTDPTAVAFTGECRLMSEDTRAWHVFSESLETRWFGGINALIPNDQTPIDEGVGDGRIPLVGADVHSFMAVIIAMDEAYNSQIVEKLNIRSLRVTG